MVSENSPAEQSKSQFFPDIYSKSGPFSGAPVGLVRDYFPYNNCSFQFV